MYNQEATKKKAESRTKKRVKSITKKQADLKSKKSWNHHDKGEIKSRKR